MSITITLVLSIIAAVAVVCMAILFFTRNQEPSPLQKRARSRGFAWESEEGRDRKETLEKRRKWAPLTGAAVVVLVAAIFLVLFWQRHGEKFERKYLKKSPDKQLKKDK